MMSYIKKMLKSKTLDVNAAILAFIAFVKAFDIEIDLTPAQVASIVTVVNLVLRFFTTKSVGDK